MMFGLMIVAAGSVSAQQFFERIEVKSYDLRWNDAGSGHKNDLALWHPKVPAGYFVFGSIGWGGNGYDPNGKVVTYAFKPLKKVPTVNGEMPGIVYPSGYTEVWLDKGSGAKKDGSVWAPVCPNNYGIVALVANSGHSKPSTKDSACLLRAETIAAYKKGLKANYVWFSSGVAKNGVSIPNLFRKGAAETVFVTFSLNVGNQMLLGIPNSGNSNVVVQNSGEALDILTSAFSKGK